MSGLRDVTSTPVRAMLRCMNARVKNLFEEAGRLTVAERVSLAQLLLASLQNETAVDAAWTAEAVRRWEEHSASGEATIEALEAVDNVRAQLRQRQKR